MAEPPPSVPDVDAAAMARALQQVWPQSAALEEWERLRKAGIVRRALARSFTRTPRRCPECDQYRYLGPGASCPDCPPSRERRLEEAARAYLAARERVDPEGEREAKARLLEVLDER